MMEYRCKVEKVHALSTDVTVNGEGTILPVRFPNEAEGAAFYFRHEPGEEETAILLAGTLPGQLSIDDVLRVFRAMQAAIQAAPGPMRAVCEQSDG